jgi:hypothetical protein
MRRLMNRLIVVLALITCVSGIQGHPKDVGQRQERNIFESVTLDLLQKTHVPLRLPSFIPDNVDEGSPIYAILESAEPASYEIQLAWTKDCKGGNACHYGTVRGSSKTLVEENRARVPVLLEGGIRGYFVDSQCGAHCDDSSIGWTEGEYHYAISLKAEKMETLLKVANSAIAAGHSKIDSNLSGAR